MIPVLSTFRFPEAGGNLSVTFFAPRLGLPLLPTVQQFASTIYGAPDLVLRAGPNGGDNAVSFYDDDGNLIMQFSRNNQLTFFRSIKFSPGNTLDVGVLDAGNSPRNIDAGTRVSAPLLYGRVIDNTAGVEGTLVLEHGSNDNAGANGDGVAAFLRQKSTTTAARGVGDVRALWVDATDATRKSRVVLSAYDTAIREFLRGESDGSRATTQVPCGSSSAFARVGGTLFDHYADAGNSTTTETDLYSDTTAASSLSVNGDKFEAEYGGVFVSSATATRQVKVYFGGTAIFDTGALTLSLSSAWCCYVTIIRVSGSVVRYSISLTTEGAALAAYTAVGELTGLTLSNTNVLKVTGQAAAVGAATNDIVAKLGTVSWKPAA